MSIITNVRTIRLEQFPNNFILASTPPFLKQGFSHYSVCHALHFPHIIIQICISLPQC